MELHGDNLAGESDHVKSHYERWRETADFLAPRIVAPPEHSPRALRPWEREERLPMPEIKYLAAILNDPVAAAMLVRIIQKAGREHIQSLKTE